MGNKKPSINEMIANKILSPGTFGARWDSHKDLSGSTFKGDMAIINRGLKSLKGAPEKVEGNFDIWDNDLVSLEFSPQEVTGHYFCMGNHLSTLKGGPQIVGGSFACRGNYHLDSLKGAPKEVGDHFDSSHCGLISLEGAPEKVNGDFDCSCNKLTSLKGAPKEVGGDFNCYGNNLESIEGFPEKIGGTFDANMKVIIRFGKELSAKGVKLPGELRYYASEAYRNGTEYTFADWFGEDLTGKTYDGNIDCNRCHLTSLKGAPKEVTGYFMCTENRLTSLEGCPEIVGDDFLCCDNKLLTSLEHGPKFVGGDMYDCSKCSLTSLKGAPEKMEGPLHRYLNSTTEEYEEGRAPVRFICNKNKLTTLEGSPKYIHGFFYCYENPLTSLKGAPEKVDIDFNCNGLSEHNENKLLISLSGGPKHVGRFYHVGPAAKIEEGFDEGVFIGSRLEIPLKSIDHIYQTIPDGCEITAYKRSNSYHDTIDVTEEVQQMKSAYYETIK